MTDTWLLLDSGPGDAAFNMALDEALLDTALRRSQPVVRFYSWTQPAASFGYFQRIAEVEAATLLRPLVRRPTGGGIVPHQADWTYSVVVPAGHAWHQLKAQASYRRIHAWIQTAFARLGIQTTLAECGHHARRGECFAGYEKDDVLWQGRKVAGAAQRRTQSGLLIQGSVQPPRLPRGLPSYSTGGGPGAGVTEADDPKPVIDRRSTLSAVRAAEGTSGPALSRRSWQEAMCEMHPVNWRPWQPDAQMQERAMELLRTKHGSQAYQRKR